MVSDTDLITRLREILKTSDLNTTSAGAVRRQLEGDFGVDLSDRKKFISQKIDEILQGGGGYGGADENVDGDDEEDGGDGGDDGENGDDDGENGGDDGDGGGDEEDQEDDEEDENDEGEEEESDEDGGSKKKKRSKVKETTSKRNGTGFTRLCSLSPPLQELVGVPEMARTEVVKNLWAYIKERDLQDPSNRRNIKCDEKLRSIFRVDTINMFQMNKALSKHIWPLEPDEGRTVDSPPLAKKQKRQKDEGTDKKTKRKENQKKGGTTGFLIPLQLSEPFVKFLGTGETTLSRADAVKRIWDYIKKNDLQDPSDKRRILCDEKLKELFDVDTFHGFSVAKYLTAHLTKIEQ